VKDYHEAHRKALEQAFLEASNSVDSLAVVCDTSIPGGSYQAVSAWSVWSFGEEVQREWVATGLALSDDAELLAISEAVARNVRELEGKTELHIFTDSLMALKWAVDPSVHSSQVYLLNLLWHVWPWLHGQPDSQVFLHYVDKDVGWTFTLWSTFWPLPLRLRQEGPRSAP